MAQNFPANPQDGDTYNGYSYNQADNAWYLPSSVYATESYVDTAVYSKLNSSEKGTPNGVAALDADGYVENAHLGGIIDSAPTNLNTLGKIAGQFNTHTTSQWASITSVLPSGSVNVEIDNLNGVVKFKLGDGSKTWDQLSYVTDSVYVNSVISPIEGDVANLQNEKADLAGATFTGDVTFNGDVDISTVSNLAGVSQSELEYLIGVTSNIQDQLDSKFNIADGNGLAHINSQTFTGNVVLPYTTTIANVGPEEINALDGISTETSIQYQIDELVSDMTTAQADIITKAPINSPTFTGTVSGVTKAMVGLGSVDNTSDANKPISSATQTELDLKAPKANPTFTGTVTADVVSITGNLTVTGTTTTVNATNLEVTDSLIYLSADQYDSDVLDIGIYGAYGDANAGHFHTGMIRDASDGKWKLVSNGTEPSSNVVDFAGITYDTLKLGAVEFADGVQTKQGVPSLTSFISKTGSYTLDALTLRDQVIEINSSSASTVTIPLDSSVNFPIGTSIDILQVGTGQVTIAATSGVTMNGTPGFKLRTQWSSATILKRAANTWIVYGDLAL